MTIDEVLKYISALKVKHWQAMQDNVTDDDKWNRSRGAYDVLGELEMIIVGKANKPKRKSIKKNNDK